MCTTGFNTISFSLQNEKRTDTNFKKNNAYLSVNSSMALDILHLNLLVHLGVLSIHAGAAFDTNAKIGLEPICSISL